MPIGQAMICDLVPEQERGTAFGVMKSVCSVLCLGERCLEGHGWVFSHGKEKHTYVYIYIMYSLSIEIMNKYIYIYNLYINVYKCI